MKMDSPVCVTPNRHPNPTFSSHSNNWLKISSFGAGPSVNVSFTCIIYTDSPFSAPFFSSSRGSSMVGTAVLLLSSFEVPELSSSFSVCDAEGCFRVLERLGRLRLCARVLEDERVESETDGLVPFDWWLGRLRFSRVAAAEEDGATLECFLWSRTFVERVVSSAIRWRGQRWP